MRKTREKPTTVVKLSKTKVLLTHRSNLYGKYVISLRFHVLRRHSKKHQLNPYHPKFRSSSFTLSWKKQILYKKIPKAKNQINSKMAFYDNQSKHVILEFLNQSDYAYLNLNFSLSCPSHFFFSSVILRK